MGKPANDSGATMSDSCSSLAETTEETTALYRAMPYKEFLQTDYWTIIRAHVIEARERCQLCSTLNGLVVHHNSYENHGSEHLHLDDLTVLCERCHMYFHRTQRLGDCVPPLYRYASFDNFSVPGADIPIARRELSGVLLAVKGYVRDFSNPKRPGLLLIGESGTGKTHLASAALNQLAGNSVRGLFYDYQDLAERLGTGMRDGSATAELDACRNVDLLLLDGIGSQRNKDWMEDAILSIIKYRCNHQKPSIGTTSLADSSAGQGTQRENKFQISYAKSLTDVIGPSARSRLFEMCTVIGMPLIEDYRLKTHG